MSSLTIASIASVTRFARRLPAGSTRQLNFSFAGPMPGNRFRCGENLFFVTIPVRSYDD